MPKEPNRLLRLLVPLIVIGAGVGVAVVVMRNTSRGIGQGTPPPQTTPASAPASTPPQSAGPAPGAQQQATETAVSSPPATTAAATPPAQPPAASAPPAAPSGPAPKYAAKAYPFSGYDSLGDLTPRDQGGKYEMRLTFSQLGAGVWELALANHFQTIRKTEHEILQRFVGGGAAAHLGLAAFAADAVLIGEPPQAVGLYASLSAPNETFWRQVAPGSFEAVIADEAGNEVLRITRRYVLDPGAYTFRIEQAIQNLGATPLVVRWQQHGPQDLPLGIMRYGGDVRRVRFGYLLPVRYDPAQIVLADDSKASFIAHQTALGSPDSNGLWTPNVLWPNEDSISKELTLAWLATTGRYFTVAMYGSEPAVLANSPAGRGADKKFVLAAQVDRVAMNAAPVQGASGYNATLVLRISGAPITVNPGASADVSVGAYAGPTSTRVLESPGAVAAMWHGVREVVIYTFGGPCGFCTFQPIAWALQVFLSTLHDFVFRDWALSIMFLVVCVRTLLHPVTRWSQTKMTRFSKQLGKMAPKQKAIQEKYKNDPVKMREEQAKLMREEKIDYFGVVGCLPPLLQTPIWIALYAMLFFFFDLRHDPAFYGVVQGATGGRWGFLGDLAEPDNFVNFHHAFGWSVSGFHVPLISGLMGPIQGLNILPLVLGVVFYIQQKYMTPPVANMTPEQEQQQKIMKVMTVVMFPVFMYNAPAGLSLYFLTNSTLGIFESKWIRAHAEKKFAEEEAAAAARVAAGVGTSMWDRKNKAPEQKGFFQRLQEAAIERQKQMEQKRKEREKKGKR